MQKHFEEWKVRVHRKEGGEFTLEKVSLVRDCVKLTEAEAEAMNHGVATRQGEVLPSYYFEKETAEA
jgi:hypothetical protein